jgi:hypothetical protein
MITLAKINWPVYPLSPNVELLDYEGFKLARNNADKDFKLLDAPSIEADSLGMRRLLYASAPSIENYQLYKLSLPIHRYADIFMFIDEYSTYIDSKGVVFKYTRSMYVPLKYHRIKKFTLLDTGALIHLPFIHTPFYINRPPRLEDKYAGLLHVGKGYVLYSIEEELKPNTRRMI